MAIVSLGPVELRCSSGLNWSTFELAWITARKQGFAQRESTLRCAFKSEHLLDIAGTPNPDDSITVDGTTYHGRCATGVDGGLHTLTARQVAARAIRIQAIQQGLKQADQAAVTITGDHHSSQPVTDQSAATDPWCAARAA